MFDYWIATPLNDQKPEGLQRLKDLVRATCLRRTKRTLINSCMLPKRTERVEWVNFHKTDRDVYRFFKDKCAKMAQGASRFASGSMKVGERKPGNLLTLINFLRLICNHGEHLLPQSALSAWNARDEAAIDWRVMESFQKKCAICDTDIEDEISFDSCGYDSSFQHWICAMCALQREDTPEKADPCPRCTASRPLRDNSGDGSATNEAVLPSAKMEALIRNLQNEQHVQVVGEGSSKPVKRFLISTTVRALVTDSLQCRFQLLD
jgi:SNF2 family DNA or RNA helicase